MGAGAGGNFGNTKGSGKNISNPVVDSKRVGSARKSDPHHSFSDIIDNYAGNAKSFTLKGGDGKTRTLYQVQGSLNGIKGIFEWIYDSSKGVTHRRFIPNGKITGRPNSRWKEWLIMYNINFDKHLNFLNWSCIYWGIQEQLIEPGNAVIYANKVIENNPDVDTPEIIELLIIDVAEKNNVLPLIERMFSDKRELNNKKSTAIRTLRYILLLEIQKNITDNQDLLDEIENIYTDFDYPSDMEVFISYMPVQEDEYDVSKHSPQENEQRLINNFNIFMSEEFNIVKKGN